MGCLTLVPCRIWLKVSKVYCSPCYLFVHGLIEQICSSITVSILYTLSWKEWSLFRNRHPIVKIVVVMSLVIIMGNPTLVRWHFQKWFPGREKASINWRSVSLNQWKYFSMISLSFQTKVIARLLQVPSSLKYKAHLCRESNCRSLRCSWSIACRHCSNYIFISP